MSKFAIRAPLAAVGLVTGITLAGCENERTAEADTPVSEAEVSTELPETVVSDETLEATANAAADLAGSPPVEVVPMPVTTGNQAAGAAGTNRATNNAVGMAIENRAAANSQ